MGSYDLTIEGDVVLGDPDDDVTRVTWLLANVAGAADRMELELRGTDQHMHVFRQDLQTEAEYAR